MEPQTSLKFKLGDQVGIFHTFGVTGVVIELRGPIGPRDMQIYRLQLHEEPEPGYVEVREDQLWLLEDSAKAVSEAV